MPIYLPPITRRQFLKGTLAAGASALFRHELFADDKPADPHTLALLSDPHIAADRAFIARGVNMTDNLTAVGRELAALPTRPAATLVNGDCAYLTGEAADYATFTSLIEPIRAAQMPIHLTLGNHDERAHFKAALAGEAKSLMTDRHVAIVRSPRANWFMLDSLDQVNKTPGILGDDQRAWLAKSLDANVDKPAIIVAHHNLEDGKSKGPLLDTAQLMEILAPRKHVKAYVYGHTHDWHVTRHDSGIHLVNLPPVAYVFGKGKPNGWVLATLEENGLRLRMNCLDRAHTAHGQVVELKWRA